MELWTIIVLIVLAVMAGLCVYNVIRLTKKIKYNPQKLFDLLVGILVFGVATIILIYFFIDILINGGWWL